MTSLRKNAVLSNNPPITDRIDQLLDTVGDGSGVTEQAAAAAEYIYRPAAGEVAELVRMLTYIQTSARISPGKYGDQTALSNGILITVKDSSDAIIHTFTPQAIKITQHWGLLAGFDITASAFTAGVDSTVIRWTFAKAGAPIILNGDRGEYLSVNVRDTLASLSSQISHVQGQKAIG